MIIAAFLSVVVLSAAGIRGALLPRGSTIVTRCLSCPYRGPGNVLIESSNVDTAASTLTCNYRNYPGPVATCTFTSTSGVLEDPSDSGCAPQTLPPTPYVCPTSDAQDVFAYNSYDPTTNTLHCGFYTSSMEESLQECTYNNEGIKVTDGTDSPGCPDVLPLCTAQVSQTRRLYKGESNLTAVKRKQAAARAQYRARRTKQN